jgi:hypothetical protein
MTHTITRNGSVIEFFFVVVQSGAEIEFALHTASSRRVGEGVMKKQ